jgi:hypothetical protein
MDNATKRKNFKCIFNPYVTKDNRDGVVRSVISQFEGYNADPEVTVTDDGFVLTVSLNDNLSSSQVRDKILWNQFVERVTTQDSIRRIQIIKLPKSEATKFVVDQFTDPDKLDEFSQGRTERPALDGEGQMSYTIGDAISFIRHADPTGDLIPESIAGGGEAVDVNIVREPSVDKEVEPVGTGGRTHRSIPKVFTGFRRISFESDTGGSFTLTTPNGFQDVNTPPASAGLQGEKANGASGIGGGAPISGASWYVYNPLNAQGTDVGSERVRGDASSAPFGNIPARSKAQLGLAASKIDEEENEQGIKGPYGATLEVLGVEGDPMGGAAYGSYFGINETYDYEGNIDDDYV